MSTYTLGQKVRFTATMTRDWHEGRGFWESHDQDPAEGIVVGKRTLSNGKLVRESETDDIGFTISSWTEYHAEEHFPAYLVAFDLRRKIVTVSPEHMEAAV